MSGINTGFGAWNPIAWALLFLGILILGFFVRSFGRKDYKRGTDQTQVFLSGNAEPEAPEGLHVSGRNLYWGMVHGLAGYYRRAREMHTGILSDYVAWFIGALGLVFIVLFWIG
jgi:hypothetical protein